MCKSDHNSTGAQVPKLWRAPPRALFVLWGWEASCLYEEHIYFERNMVAR
jgi:hypothetical protein